MKKSWFAISQLLSNIMDLKFFFFFLKKKELRMGLGNGGMKKLRIVFFCFVLFKVLTKVLTKVTK